MSSPLRGGCEGAVSKDEGEEIGEFIILRQVLQCFETPLSAAPRHEGPFTLAPWGWGELGRMSWEGAMY